MTVSGAMSDFLDVTSCSSKSLFISIAFNNNDLLRFVIIWDIRLPVDVQCSSQTLCIYLVPEGNFGIAA